MNMNSYCFDSLVSYTSQLNFSLFITLCSQLFPELSSNKLNNFQIPLLGYNSTLLSISFILCYFLVSMLMGFFFNEHKYCRIGYCLRKSNAMQPICWSTNYLLVISISLSSIPKNSIFYSETKGGCRINWKISQGPEVVKYNMHVYKYINGKIP